MSFNTALQHLSSITFHSRGGISIPMQSWSHRVLVQWADELFLNQFSNLHPGCKTIWKLYSTPRDGNAQEKTVTVWKQASLCTAPGRSFHRPHSCLWIPHWWEQCFKSKMLCKAQKTCSKGRGTKSLAIFWHQLSRHTASTWAPIPLFKNQGKQGFPPCYMLLHSASTVWWEFWYKGRWHAHIQQLPVHFWRSTSGHEPCLTSCHQPNWASLTRLRPTLFHVQAIITSCY